MGFLRLTFVAIFLLISLTVLVFTETHPATKSAAEDVVPINKTSGIQILQARLDGNELKLSMKNNYAQRITAWVLTVGKGFRVTEDLIFAEAPAEPGIRPQQTFERSFTLSSRDLTGTITVQAVVLADKTGDGDEGICAKIQETRLGQAVQVKRALKVLENYVDDSPDIEKLNIEMNAALDRPEADTLEAIKELRPVGSKNHDVLSDDIKEGLIAGRSTILTKVNEAKTFPYKKDYVRRMRTYYERLLNRL